MGVGSDRGEAYIEVAALPGKKLWDAKYAKGKAVRKGKREEKSEEKRTGLKTRHYKRKKRKDAGLKPRRYISEGLSELGTMEVDGTIEEGGFPLRGQVESRRYNVDNRYL